MKTLLVSAMAVATWLNAAPAKATTCADLQRDIKKTYGFRPSKLAAPEREQKSKQMDEVWHAVESEPAALGPCLRDALLQTKDDPWFLFDGAQLLMSVDSYAGSKKILLDALSKVSLDDVDLRVWVHAASALGLEGFDTSAAGRRWLAYPQAEYFLPEHGAYRVDRGNGAMFIFGALDERFATPALIELAEKSSGQTKEIAVWLLMSQTTPEALRALPRLNRSGLSKEAVGSLEALLKKPALIEPRRPPKTSRQAFLAAFASLLKGDDGPFDRLVDAVPDGERDLVAVATPADLEVIRKVRRHYIARNTPHAIEYYNQFSQILMTLVWGDSSELSTKTSRLNTAPVNFE